MKPLFLLVPLLVLAPPPQQTTPAPAPAAVPADAAAMVNPFKPSAEGLARAKKMYGYDCAMCHGVNGNGKAELTDSMKLTVKDFTDRAAMKDLTDGQIFYIVKNGAGQMPGEGDRLKPQELWTMVVLVRSFAKN
jgi:mono/diheme cytochrome c family protein